MKYKVKPIKTKYWLPGENYIDIIVKAINCKIADEDIITISEKAISTAKGNIIDESKVRPSSLAKFIAFYVMRIIWGYILANISRLKYETIWHLRNYPKKEGAAHKQVALKYGGLLQALKYGSEWGIDISNLPYEYACLPLQDPEDEAIRIFREIKSKVNKNITLIIVDTDLTFSIGGFHFTARPKPIKGIRSFGGAISFILGRALKLRQRATPLALVGTNLGIEEVLEIAELSHHSRGYGSGRSVWNMVHRFNTELTNITWKMLEGIDHYPIVLVRRKWK